MPQITMSGADKWLQPVVSPDPSDPKLAHLDGLNRSRAWMLEGIAALVTSYTDIPHDQLQANLQKASFSAGQGDMGGSAQIMMSNVLQGGDTFTIWIDRQAMLFRRVSINTSYEQKPVTVQANYAMLPGGQVYMAQAIVNYPAKQVVVKMDNLNYQGH